MNRTNAAISTGFALAVTVAIGYSSCALFFWLWPEAAVTFTNALFHGLDFRKLQTGGAAFNFGGFFYVLCAMAVWGFILGAIFGWLQGERGSSGG